MKLAVQVKTCSDCGNARPVEQFEVCNPCLEPPPRTEVEENECSVCSFVLWTEPRAVNIMCPLCGSEMAVNRHSEKQYVSR